MAKCQSIGKSISKGTMDIGRLLYPESSRRQLPLTRSECPAARPCPYVSCRYNTYLDVTPAGHLSVPTHEPWEHPAELSCALDSNGATLEEVGAAFGLTRERARQIENIAQAKLRARAPEIAALLEAEVAPEVVPYPPMKGDF